MNRQRTRCLFFLNFSKKNFPQNRSRFSCDILLLRVFHSPADAYGDAERMIGRSAAAAGFK